MMCSTSTTHMNNSANSSKPVQAFVRENEHIYEVLRVAVNLNTTIIPVIDDELNYLGLITLQSLLYNFAKMIPSALNPVNCYHHRTEQQNRLCAGDIARALSKKQRIAYSEFVFQYEKETGKHAVTIKVDSTEIKTYCCHFRAVRLYHSGIFQNQIWSRSSGTVMIH